MSDEKFSDLPEDLTSVDADELSQLEQTVKSRYDELAADDESDLNEFTKIADAYEAITSEIRRRGEEAEQQAAAREQIKNRISSLTEAVAEGEDNEGEESENTEQAENAPALVAGGAVTKPRSENRRKLNPSLAEIAKRAPKVDVEGSDEAVITAGADIAGFTQGGRIKGMDKLTLAIHNRVKTLPDGRGAYNYVPVASIEKKFKHTLDLNVDMESVRNVLNDVANPDNLIAAGGWCAPSEIRYDFYNIACEDGLIDLPTVGVRRGGIQWPVSPSFGDVADSEGLWSWTEAQDIAAVTGTGGGVKTCVRIPCPDFEEQRLQCDGLCLTAGNLMDYAYPENIANFTRLLMIAHARRMSLLQITSLVAQSTNVGTFAGVGADNPGTVAAVLGALELQATDYREKYAMCEDAVIEVILPRWLRGSMRSDLTKRTGVDLIAVADSVLMSYFDAINVRVQWVGDWQVRGAGVPGGDTPLTTWPATVSFLLYAPGTFVRGNGLTLDLGVIRDSVLNETNDFTAAWMEECWLIAMFGHESRFGTINICPDGVTGAAAYDTCPSV